MTRLRDTLPPSACEESREWLGKRRSATKAWQDCPRGDWMLWLLAKRGADLPTLVLAACACARLALVHVPEGDDRPRLAIEAAEAWARGEGVDLATVCTAADAAYAAAYAAYAAAYAAADAAYAADAAAYAAYAAAYAGTARAANLAQCADIVRKHFPEPPEVIL